MKSKKAKKKTATKPTLRRWTSDDDKALKAMAKEGKPTPSIAKKLKRSMQAIYIRASANGISLRSKRK